MKSNTTFIKKFFKAISILLISLLIMFAFCCFQVFSYSDKYSDKSADVIIVLGAGTNDGQLSNIFRERMNHGINLMKDDKAKYLMITGGIAQGQKISDSKAAKNYAISQNIPDDKILIEEISTTTFTNILNAKIIMQKKDLKNALIVSDPYHMKRSMKMCSKIGIDAEPSPTPTTMYRTKKVKRKFLMNQGFNYAIYLMFEQFKKVKH